MGSLDDVVARLRDVLATVENIDLWPPQDAARTLVNAVAEALVIMVVPPAPAPEALTDTASAWRAVAASVSDGCDDLATCRDEVDRSAWDGSAGDAFRASIGRLRSRTATVPPAARAVADALDQLAAEMTDARSRHARADDMLRDHLQLSWGDLWPWELVDFLRGIVGSVERAITEAIGAYQDAADAVRIARRAIRSAMDEIELPDSLPKGVSPVAVVNGWDDEDGPLSGSALQDYDAAFADLTPAQQQAVRDALAGARSDEERAWIIAGVASGLSGAALAAYVAKLHTMSRNELDALTPPSDGRYDQPDRTTCGSSTLVMSRMLSDPAYALWIETGFDPATGETDTRTAEERFDAESLAMHERTNALTDREGELQTPWPEALGTAPWAVANEMSSENGSGRPGTDYEVRTVSPSDRGTTYDRIADAVESGHHVPLYVGDTTRPGHVVLVTGGDGDTITLYEPFEGLEQTVSRDDFVNGELGVAGWDEPWFAVTPT